MQFLASLLTLSVAVLPAALGRPIPSNQKLSEGNVVMTFEVGGKNEYMVMPVWTTECMSVASGGLLTSMQISSDVQCTLHPSGCSIDEDASFPISGDVNLNGSGQLGMMAAYTRAIKCQPRQSDEFRNVVRMKFKRSGVSESVEMRATEGGCFSVDQGTVLTGMNIAEGSQCSLLPAGCGQTQEVTRTIRGIVDFDSHHQLRSLAKDTRAVKCGPSEA